MKITWQHITTHKWTVKKRILKKASLLGSHSFLIVFRIMVLIILKKLFALLQDVCYHHISKTFRLAVHYKTGGVETFFRNRVYRKINIYIDKILGSPGSSLNNCCWNFAFQLYHQIFSHLCISLSTLFSEISFINN